MRRPVPILVPRWYCPNCGLHLTEKPRVRPAGIPISQFHICPALAGLTAPMLPEGVKAKVERHDREDYVGREKVQVDGEGRPVMSITTTRDQGTDCMVFVPTATATGDAHMTE